MILGDRDLRYYIDKGLIRVEPFDPEIVRENGIDLRIGSQIARLRRTSQLLDVRSVRDLEEYYEVEDGSSFVIYPGERVLLSTLEYIKLPDDLMGFVELRSTYARLGLSLPPTIVDAGFEGNITLEVLGSSFPVKLYSGDRFAHVIFAKTLSPVEKPYSGRYQKQRGVTLPRF